MEFQFNSYALFVACLRSLLLAVKATIHATSIFVMGFISLMAKSTITSEEDENAEEGDLTGDYNFRTRKFDNGTDPYGWYEEDL